MKPAGGKVRRSDFRHARNYYLAIASEIAGPALRAAARLHSGRPTARECWRKGLVISHTHIGDVLYRTASLDHLAAALPNCEWHYLVSPGSADVLRGNPAIARVHALVEGEDSWTLSKGGFGRLKEESYDVALCTNSMRHYPDLALAAALGIPNRVAFGNRGLSGLITNPVQFPDPRPYPAYFREMVAQLCSLEPTWPLRPRLYPSPGDIAAADDFLAGFGDSALPLVACCPITRQPRGQWPADFFQRTLNALAAKFPIRVVFCGGAEQRDALTALAVSVRAPSRVSAGSLNLGAFGALLSKSRVILAHDSGPRHLGNAVGTPVIFLRNLSFLPEEAGAYCASETDVVPPVRVDTDAEIAALQDSVDPEMVAEKLLAALRR